MSEAKRMAKLVNRRAEDVGDGARAHLLPPIAVVEFDVAGVVTAGDRESKPAPWRSDPAVAADPGR